MINNLSAYSFTNNDVLTLYSIASSALTTGTLNPQTAQIRDGGYAPPPVPIVYSPRDIDGEDSLIFDSYLCEGSSVSVNLSTTSTCVNLATGYDLLNFGYELLIEERGQVLSRMDTFNYNNSFNIACSASLLTGWRILSGSAVYNKQLSGTSLDLLPVGSYRRTTSPNDRITVKYYLPIDGDTAPIFWPGELLNVYKTKKIVWDMFSIRLGGEDLKGDYIPFKLSERTYIVDQSRDLTLYNPQEILYLDKDFSLSAVQIGNTILGNTGNFGTRDGLGYSVDTNDSGTRMVVGGPYSDSNLLDAFDRNQGVVRVYELVNSSWIQLGEDLVVGEDQGYFGWSVSMNGSGTRIAASGYKINAGGSDRGQTRIFDWDGSAWVLIGTIDGLANNDWSGWSIKLNTTGDRLAIISDRGGDGHIGVFEYVGGSWTQLGTSILGNSAYSTIEDIDINSVGDIVAYGTIDNGGAVEVYKWDGSVWNILGGTIPAPQGQDYTNLTLFGRTISLNAAGDVIAVATVVTGTGGIVYVYKYDGVSWNQLGDKLVSSETVWTSFGTGLTLNANGDRIAIGKPTGNTSGGVVVVYEFNGREWVKINEDIYGNGSDHFGHSISFNTLGDRLVVGAYQLLGGYINVYSLPEYPLITLAAFKPYKSVMLWSDGHVTENYFTSPFYLPDNTIGSSYGVINFRKFSSIGEYTILTNTFHYKNTLDFERVIFEPYNITYVAQ